MKPTITRQDSIQANSGHVFFNENSRIANEINWVNLIFKHYFNYAKDLYKRDVPQYSLAQNYAFERLEKILASFILLCASPVMLCVAIGIRMTSKGDIFYRQVRVGKGGRTFEILKFRTMVSDAEAQTGHVLSWEDDPRITKFGNFLRKSHLDELPQLFNVISGDMAFIGPRPERPEFTETYDANIEKYSDRHLVKPGITGLAQIALVYDATAEEKLKFDLLYISYRNELFLNFLIGWYTLKKMFFLTKTANLTDAVDPVNN